MDAIIEEILTELKRAQEKFPYWPADYIHAAAIVNEESGELIRAALRFRYEGGDKDEMRVEAIQTAAMCIRFLKTMQ